MITAQHLSQFPLFRDLPEDLLAKIAAQAEEMTVAKNEYIFREGEEADKVHFLLKGSIALRVKLTSRPESITVSFVNRPNEIFGWSGLVPPHHYTASAFCEEDCQILAIPGQTLMQILRENPQAGFVVMQRMAEVIADRLRNSRQALLKTI